MAAFSPSTLLLTTYSRSTLLSLRYWWKNLPNKIQPVLPTKWNALKSVGILRPTRGKRAGVHCGNSQRDGQQIPCVSPNMRLSDIVGLRARRSRVSRKYTNLLNIQSVTFPSTTGCDSDSVALNSLERPFFVPSLLLSNTMSLAPKIDEIAHTISTLNPDIAFFTETWLNEAVPDDPISINGYQLFRRDRANRQHGGVCMYVKTPTECKILSDLHDIDHEVLWADLRPRRLPRGFSNIVVGLVYHPPDAHDVTMRDHLISSLEKVESRYPNSAIIMAGDFNKTLLPLFRRAAKAFQLKPMVDFPTRGENTLDQLFTNIPEYYSRPSSLPAFGLSDHLTVIMKAGTRDKSSKPKCKTIKSRDKRPSKVAEVGRFLYQVPWSGLFSQDQSSEDKLRILTEVINFGLNTIMPERSVRVHETDRPWLTSQLKALIARRQKAFSSGNELLYKMLRNKVNCERKRCRSVYYENKVKDLRVSKPRNWWREVKQLCGATRNTGRDLKSVLHSDLGCEETTLAESVNEAFTSVTKDYSPLTNCFRVPRDGDQPISVNEQSVVKKLRAVKTSRAGGPDDLPNWMLREFADILAAPIADILNTSFSECKVPRVWKIADVSPLPKAPTVCDFNKDLRPISLTSTLSKIAESFVIEKSVKPAVLSSIDPNQYGFIPGSSTTFALISMLHHWLGATDGTGAAIRTAFVDFRKAFDLVDHQTLIAKLLSLEVKPTSLNWSYTGPSPPGKPSLQEYHRAPDSDLGCFSR